MPKILVVEDDPPIRELLSQVLSLSGYTVVTEPDGARGLARARSEDHDLIVLDLMVPGVDGLSILRQLRDEDATRSTPVVILTARTDDETTWAGWRGGCDYYLTKPFEPGELVDIIERLLNDRRVAPA